MPRLSLLILSSRSNLGSTRFSCNIIALNSSLSGKTYRCTLCQHSNNFLGGFFLDNTTEWLRCILGHMTIPERNGVHNIWLIVNSSVCECHIGCRHLEWSRHYKPLSERSGKQVCSRPLFITWNSSINLTLKSNIRLCSKSKIYDILIKEGFSYFLGNINHSDIARPVQRMSIGISTKTFF